MFFLFQVTLDTKVTYLSRFYRHVFILDLSPSTIVAVRLLISSLIKYQFNSQSNSFKFRIFCYEFNLIFQDDQADSCLHEKLLDSLRLAISAVTKSVSCAIILPTCLP